MDMSLQITDVVRTLFSVRKMKQAGNIVIFGADEGDMIINKKSGSIIPIDDDGKSFTMDICIPPGETEEPSKKTEFNIPVNNYWAALCEGDNKTFRRHP